MVLFFRLLRSNDRVLCGWCLFRSILGDINNISGDLHSKNGLVRWLIWFGRCINKVKRKWRILQTWFNKKMGLYYDPQLK
jgi:hypothetical protein